MFLKSESSEFKIETSNIYVQFSNLSRSYLLFHPLLYPFFK